MKKRMLERTSAAFHSMFHLITYLITYADDISEEVKSAEQLSLAYSLVSTV